jgi:hypothetical protein
MFKKPKRIIGISIYGFIVGLYISLPSLAQMHDIQFLIMGLICIFLSFGFLMLWRWVIIPILVASVLFIIIYVLLIIAALMNAYQGFGVIAVGLYSPLLILVLLFIDALTRKEIRRLFTK